MKKCIILGNGNPPKKSLLNFLDSKGYSTLICADGGSNAALKYDIIPDVIIGDLDSIKPETYDYFYDKCKIIKIKDQYSTDIEKCLMYSIKQKFVEAVLVGVTGDRLDHSFCNLGIVLKYFNKIKIKVIHEKSILEAITGDVILKTVPGEIISLYGFDSKTKIKSSGLKYPLRNISLPFGKKDGTSNVALGNVVKLNIKYGKIFIVRDFNMMKQHGLF
ncbi:thiamine diphosphokinase [Rosettibacter firmus]|uniref:thiamine diphosphokinase n=1 Tax=Rosettibacter firmus TaxID=3111522 RepID=UPI00336C2D5E